MSQERQTKRRGKKGGEKRLQEAQTDLLNCQEKPKATEKREHTGKEAQEELREWTENFEEKSKGFDEEAITKTE